MSEEQQHVEQAQEPDTTALVEAPMASIPIPGEEDDDDEDDGQPVAKKAGRRKINIEFIEDKSRRHITFSKRKAGIMKKAYELSALTGTQVLLLVASETGHVYTYATEKLQPLIQKPEGKNLIQTCLSAPDNVPTSDAGKSTAQQVTDAQYAAMAAAANAAQQAAAADRPAKQRKVNTGQPAPGGYMGGGMPPNMANMAGMPGMPGMNPYAMQARGFPGSIGAGAMPPGLAAQAAARGGLPFGMDARSMAAMQGQGIPGMPAAAAAAAAQLQGLSPALLQGLMSGQLPTPAMMGFEGAFGGGAGGGKMEALQQTIADAANAANMHREMQ